MSRAEIIEILVGNYNEDLKELKKMNKSELLELLEEYTDISGIFPNGRDYDAESY